jgi:hypothetical protein
MTPKPKTEVIAPPRSPSAAPSAAPKPASGAAGEGGSLPDAIVDASVLDGLIELTRDERQLESFRARALAMKQKVDAAVSARVLADYETRLRALRAEAEPLRARARSEWEKLRALYAEVGGREGRARLDKQELEFRHEVGEIDEAELRDRVKTPEAVLDTCRADVAALDRQKARFLEVFTEEDLAAPATPSAPPPAGAPAATVRAEMADAAVTLGTAPAGVPDARSEGGGAATAKPVAPTAAAALGAADASDATMIGPLPVPVDEAAEEGTLILPEGVLVVLDAGGGEATHRLSAMTYIGRSDDNQVRVQRGGVSRRHALIVAERAGFRIEDLGSQNGTLVNGKQVQRAALAHGDIITLGDAKLRFEVPSTRQA